MERVDMQHSLETDDLKVGVSINNSHGDFRADINEILPALDHLLASDASGIDREGLTNVLNELTTVSEGLTQFLETDDWESWEHARTKLNHLSSMMKGIAINLSGV
ncbi:hypothetical protein [Exiguobacterium aurantiacum]|uniref:Uncharacterized protein n=1 Tax=Exiguobacterium aurantiacum TaxID=33987 RepID=A0ABY5FJA9_9BACL|nr:hypothetical protein [Exiguobacterium aurantiacum]UTT41566.1 hypothetical protein NMQ00_08290 [Exiguobacterium aurantiacum]